MTGELVSGGLVSSNNHNSPITSFRPKYQAGSTKSKAIYGMTTIPDATPNVNNHW